MLELTTSKLDLKLDGVHYSIRFPTVLEWESYNSAITKDGSEILKAMELLNKCGLPNDVCEKLELPHFKAILETLATEKKS